MKTLREYIDLIKEAEQLEPNLDQQAKERAEQDLDYKKLIASKLLSMLGSGSHDIELESIGSSANPAYDYQINLYPNIFSGENFEDHYMFIIWGPQDPGGTVSISGHFMCNDSAEQERMREELDNSWSVPSTGAFNQTVSEVAAYAKKIKPVIDKWVATNQNV